MKQALVARGREESGLAMVMAMIVMLVTSGLAAAVYYTSIHTTNASGRNRCWGAAVHIAESGVHDAIARIQGGSGTPPAGTVSGTTAEGGYEYQVTSLPRRKYQIDSVGTCGTSSSLTASRRLRVTLEPPLSFSYALFSLSDVTTKNNNIVCGDIWANTDVVVFQNDEVLSGDDPDCEVSSTGGGSVTAATGSVTLQNNSSIAGDSWSGGYDSSGRSVSLGNGAQIGGNVKAASSTPGCADDPTSLKYIVDNGGTIGGNITTWGTLIGGGPVGGAVLTFTCTTAPTPKVMPAFDFNAANYGGTVQTFASPSAFDTYLATNGSALSGTFYIEGGGANDAVDLSGVDIAGDTTIIAESAPIDGNGVGSVDANTTDKLLVLVSYYGAPASSCSTNGGNPGDCAIGFKNNFQQSDNTAVLLYAPNGPIAFKNNASFFGAVYGNNIQVKNNMNITYDPRVDQIIGFGPVTLDVTQWLECAPGAVTTSDC